MQHPCNASLQSTAEETSLHSPPVDTVDSSNMSTMSGAIKSSSGKSKEEDTFGWMLEAEGVCWRKWKLSFVLNDVYRFYLCKVIGSCCILAVLLAFFLFFFCVFADNHAWRRVSVLYLLVTYFI